MTVSTEVARDLARDLQRCSSAEQLATVLESYSSPYLPDEDRLGEADLVHAKFCLEEYVTINALVRRGWKFQSRLKAYICDRIADFVLTRDNERMLEEQGWTKLMHYRWLMRQLTTNTQLDPESE
jgi:hypothetical protein